MAMVSGSIDTRSRLAALSSSVAEASWFPMVNRILTGSSCTGPVLDGGPPTAGSLSAPPVVLSGAADDGPSLGPQPAVVIAARASATTAAWRRRPVIYPPASDLSLGGRRVPPP